MVVLSDTSIRKFFIKENFATILCITLESYLNEKKLYMSVDYKFSNIYALYPQYNTSENPTFTRDKVQIISAKFLYNNAVYLCKNPCAPYTRETLLYNSAYNTSENPTFTLDKVQIISVTFF